MRSRQRGFIMTPYGSVTVDANALAFYNAVLAGGKGAYWEFEENAAGTSFLDSTGNANHLSNRSGASLVATSTKTIAGGQIGRAYAPTSGSQDTAYIPRSNTNLDLPDTDWTFGGWFKASGSAGTARFLIGRIGAFSASKFQAGLLQDGATDVFTVQVSSDGNAVTTVASTIAANANWRFITVTLDRTNNLIRLRVRDVSGSPSTNNTTAFASALFTTATNANFCVSQILNNDSTFSVAGSREINGRADCGFYCSKAITDNEYDYLFNAGVGKTWAQIAADAGH